jgi:DNA-binding NarL/FixJ family response regulator
MEVLQLMVDGESNEAIADTLVLSIQTVRNHASSIYRKLGVSSRVEAVLAAMRLGMEPSPPAGAEPP